MNYSVRPIAKEEYSLLSDFLYEAIYIPDGSCAPPRSILEQPELRVYIEDFGKQDDYCLIAEADGKAVGAVWARIMHDYGHIDDETPSLAMSVLKKYRSVGIGSRLMSDMLLLLRQKGFTKVSLSVQKSNYAVNMYKKFGFESVDETECEYIMVRRL